ncbi:MAG TPA: PAS domain-containing protein [Stellaceae bacterium]|nr:PAS domain-containing protein [Stellaceae bacterium]
MSASHRDFEFAIADEKTRRFFQYWREKRGDRKYPARADLDPVDFFYVLGDVVMVDAARAAPGGRWPWAFRYRLVGTKIVQRDGYDLTGKPLDDLPEPEYRERVRATWLEACETGLPAHRVRDLLLDRRIRRYEVIVLPLASNGEDIDMLISVQRQLPSRPEAVPR